MLLNRLGGGKDTHLYWTYFSVWICAILPAVFATALFFDLFRQSDPRWVVPIAMAILWSPLVALGMYGIIKGYSASLRYGYIYRGTTALVWNIFPIIIYVVILVLVLAIGGDKVI
jgi:hypothetical protein